MTTAAAGTLSVEETINIKAPLERVWSLFENFHACWIDGINVIKVDEKTRRMEIPDGGSVTERLLSHCETEHQITYQIVTGNLPVDNYQSAMLADSASTEEDLVRVTWKSSFTAKDISNEQAISIISGLYKMGLDALKKKAELN